VTNEGKIKARIAWRLSTRPDDGKGNTPVIGGVLQHAQSLEAVGFYASFAAHSQHVLDGKSTIEVP
jgi:hypothetical protein